MINKTKIDYKTIDGLLKTLKQDVDQVIYPNKCHFTFQDCIVSPNGLESSYICTLTRGRPKTIAWAVGTQSSRRGVCSSLQLYIREDLIYLEIREGQLNEMITDLHSSLVRALDYSIASDWIAIERATHYKSRVGALGELRVNLSDFNITDDCMAYPIAKNALVFAAKNCVAYASGEFSDSERMHTAYNLSPKPKQSHSISIQSPECAQTAESESSNRLSSIIKWGLGATTVIAILGLIVWRAEGDIATILTIVFVLIFIVFMVVVTWGET